MITIDEFYRAYTSFRPRPNDQQSEVIEAEPTEPLFIVAGPGTGKTATLTLRILKLILVDGLPPRSILATTFTKKAAAELRSRILSWGFQLVEVLQQDLQIDPAIRQYLSTLDINQVITGTIDSICEQLLREFRDPGAQPPVLADDFVVKTLILRDGLFPNQNHTDPDLDELLFDLSAKQSTFGWHTGTKTDLIQTIWDRRFQDQIDWQQYIQSGTGTQAQALQRLDDIVTAYRQSLEDRSMIDFALLEQAFLDRLRQDEPKEFLEQLQVILVDEYQDTNLMQESIYFAMARSCGGALNVVGDDDQSLYRFRGATVELFSDFDQRYQQAFGNRPNPVFLQTNYRSTETIITFVNDYATLDTGYQRVRVNAKPALQPGPQAPKGIPILGMFRDSTEVLAADLADFVAQVFRGGGFILPNGQTIQCDPNGGDLGDAALLCSSPAEYNSGKKARLPLLLRDEMETLGIPCFNPRGQELTEIPLIEQFGGLLLECLDPGGSLACDTSGITRDMNTVFERWRTAALDFVVSDSAPIGLLDYAQGWAMRDPGRSGYRWPPSTPVLDLIYGLTHFFPTLHNDPEGQIYLEVFTRQVSACEQVGKFSGRVLYEPSNLGLGEASVKELLRDFLGPIAAGAIKVNEELMDSFPRDRLSILSIHQSKGLEFPLTIVDVGSDFRSNHAAHRFKRHPRQGGAPHRMEDRLRPYSTLGQPNRQSIDRAFDDLYRQYFVAYSRPQLALLLVGLNPTHPGGRVSNVATGWDRDENSTWVGNHPYINI